VKNFIQLITSNYGAIQEIDSPYISLPPLLNLQHTEAKLSYLSSVTFYLGGKCETSDYYRQVVYPVNTEVHLSSKDIVKFLNTSRPSYPKRINLVVSDVTEYEYLKGIMKDLSFIKKNVVFYSLLTDKNKGMLTDLAKDFGYKFTFICRTCSVYDSTIEEMNRYGSFSLLILNDEDYSRWDNLTEGNAIGNYNMIPVYDNNIKFFEENIYLNKEDLKNIKLPKREVFAHQAINTNFFGDITVMPNGKVFSNVNFPSIGSLNDTLHEIINNEMKDSNAWRLLRDSGRCRKCLYQWLCPSISNYELVIGRNDLCRLPESKNASPTYAIKN
jgi:pseudo-rSAM protein